MNEVVDIGLFFLAIAKVAMLCGFAPAIAIVFIAECCDLKIVALGFEQVSGRAVSRHQSVEYQQVQSGNKPARNVLARVA